METSEPKTFYETKHSESIEDVMTDLAQKVNQKSQEGLVQLNKPVKTNNDSILLEHILQGAKEFEQRVGRPMTYCEMRSMWG